MKTVLCFGDSLTWGSVPAIGTRHSHAMRWPNVVQAGLGDSVEIVTDAVRGRSTTFDDYTSDGERNGTKAILQSLYAHAPVDLVVIMLGSNDMKLHVCGSAFVTMQGMRRLVELVRSSNQRVDGASVPDVLIVAPPPIVETANADYAAQFIGADEESQMLATLYGDLAEELECGFFDAASISEASPLDGVHLDADNTRALGQALAPVIKLMLGE